MRALVTGATGFIGSHVTRQLVEQGIHFLNARRALEKSVGWFRQNGYVRTR